MVRRKDEPNAIEQHGSDDHPCHEEKLHFEYDVGSPLKHEKNANETERLASTENVDDDAQGAEEYDEDGSEKDYESDVLRFNFFGRKMLDAPEELQVLVLFLLELWEGHVDIFDFLEIFVDFS